MTNHVTIASRLTHDRIGSDLATTGHDLDAGLRLYDWYIRLSGSFHDDIGRIEVVFRNTIDAALVTYGSSRQWPTVRYRRSQLFPGKHGDRTRKISLPAQTRAREHRGKEVHGRVVAELGFGFWRFLNTDSQLTSLWVAALAGAFARHPQAGNPRVVRADGEDRVHQLHFLRNRIAHHEPIHQRDLRRDVNDLIELAGSICTDTQTWIANESRTAAVLSARP